MVRPDFPKHFPASKNTTLHAPSVTLDHYEYAVASGYRTLNTAVRASSRVLIGVGRLKIAHKRQS